MEYKLKQISMRKFKSRTIAYNDIVMGFRLYKHLKMWMWGEEGRIMWVLIQSYHDIYLNVRSLKILKI